MRRIIFVFLLFLFPFVFSQNVLAANQCICKTIYSGNGNCIWDPSTTPCSSGEVCDCGAATFINTYATHFSCDPNVITYCTAGPTTAFSSTNPGQISCDICKCRSGSTVVTSDCLTCDSECEVCILPKPIGTYKNGGSYTALGCIPTGDFNDFVVWFLQRAIGIAGGIAFLLMISGGFKILVSGGDPKGVQAGGETITSALTGLLFIIFSVFLLELIGVKILGIPGL